MEVLWGAWVKHTELGRRGQDIDVIGIYDEIWRKNKTDYPFSIDLQVIIAFQSYLSESNREFTMTLEVVNASGQIIYTRDELLCMPETLDATVQWYESYKLDGIRINEPGEYQLSILINGEVKRIVPLHVIATKMVIYDPEKDSTTEMWPEDWKPKDDQNSQT